MEGRGEEGRGWEKFGHLYEILNTPLLGPHILIKMVRLEG